MSGKEILPKEPKGRDAVMLRVIEAKKYLPSRYVEAFTVMFPEYIGQERKVMDVVNLKTADEDVVKALEQYVDWRKKARAL